MRNDADSHELLAVVAAVHHERVGETLNDGAVGLAEPLGGIATGGVREVDRGADLDVVAEERSPVSLRRVPLIPQVLRMHPLPRPSRFAARAYRRVVGRGGAIRCGVGEMVVLLRQRDIPDLDILVAPTV